MKATRDRSSYCDLIVLPLEADLNPLMRYHREALPSVLRCLFRLVNHHNIDRALLSFQPEPELLLQTGEHRRSCRIRRLLGVPFESEIVRNVQAGLIQHYSSQFVSKVTSKLIHGCIRSSQSDLAGL